jgi:hypothetical protein
MQVEGSSDGSHIEFAAQHILHALASSSSPVFWAFGSLRVVRL